MTTTTSALEHATQQILDMLLKECEKRQIPPTERGDSMPVILKEIQRRILRTKKKDEATMTMLSVLSDILRGYDAGFVSFSLKHLQKIGRSK
jgi:hypothetical protein